MNSTPLTALEEAAARRGNPLRVIYRFIVQKPLGGISGIGIVLVVLMAVFAPLLSPYDPAVLHPSDYLSPPGSRYLLGTDQAGRDILSNIIYGSRISLWVGIAAMTMGVGLGVISGLISGYFERWADFIIQRAVDALMAIPTIVLAMAIIAVLGTSVTNVVLALAITIIPRTSRLVRGSTLSAKQEQYVEAARAIGAGNFRVMFLHVLPNIFAPILVIASITIGGAILSEAALSFLGLGPPPPLPSWGRMLGGDNTRFMVRAPWMLIVPGTVITLTVLAFNLLGDALRDVLDPRLRGSRGSL